MENNHTLGMESYVDPAILDIIQEINELPFVECTLWSCAGYGDHAELTVWPLRDGSVGIRNNVWKKHCRPYVTIQYRFSPIHVDKAIQFHKELKGQVHQARQQGTIPRAYHYHLLKPGKYLDLEEVAAAKWEGIRKLVLKYRKE